MPVFKSYQDFNFFANYVKHSQRYVYNSEMQKFLKCVLGTSAKRLKTLKQGGLLWRSQIGSEERLERDEAGHPVSYDKLPLLPQRMIPHSEIQQTEGRANPAGIPCLYLASDKDTAMTEQRPWLATEISVGRFKLTKDLTVIDCGTINRHRRLYFKEPSPIERELYVWSDICRAFSRPVDKADGERDYIPTQILAELFKSNGYDGVMYVSSIGKGNNIALFDVNVAKLTSCFLFETKNISYKFDECANPYFVK